MYVKSRHYCNQSYFSNSLCSGFWHHAKKNNTTKIQACSLFVLNCLFSSLSAPGVLSEKEEEEEEEKKKKKKQKEEEEEEEEESHSLFFCSVCTYSL